MTTPRERDRLAAQSRPLFDTAATPAPLDPRPQFGGETYDPQQDQVRLATTLGRVWDLMRDGQARTLRQIVDLVGCSEAGASARIRDLRKPQFQRHHPTPAVESTRGPGGRWVYRIRGAPRYRRTGPWWPSGTPDPRRPR